MSDRRQTRLDLGLDSFALVAQDAPQSWGRFVEPEAPQPRLPGVESPAERCDRLCGSTDCKGTCHL